MKIISKIFVVSFVLFGALLLSGCETTKGFGQDLEKGGKAIQKAATGDNSQSTNNTAKK